MGLPKFGKLDGRDVELTREFIASTPGNELAKVTIEMPEGGTMRPFRCCQETPDQQIGLAGDE
jgi:hypothetical protein